MESTFQLGQEILESVLCYIFWHVPLYFWMSSARHIISIKYRFSVYKDYIVSMLISLYLRVLCMHVPTVVPHFLTRSLFLEFSFDHVLEFHSIHSKLSDTLGQLFRCHLIFIQKPAEFLLVQRNFLNVKFCSCKNTQKVLLVHSEISFWKKI